MRHHESWTDSVDKEPQKTSAVRAAWTLDEGLWQNTRSSRGAGNCPRDRLLPRTALLPYWAMQNKKVLKSE